MAKLLGQSLLHKILVSGFSTQELDHLNDLLNGEQEIPTSVSLLPNKSNSIGIGNRGTSYVSMEIEEGKIVTGFLCFKNNNNCALFSFVGTQEEMCSIELDPTNATYLYHYDGLDIEEFRRELADMLINGGQQAEVTPSALMSIIEPGQGFVAEVNEQGKKVDMHLDADVIDGTLLAIPDDVELDENGLISFTVPETVVDRLIEVFFEIENSGVHFGGHGIAYPSNEGNVCTTVGGEISYDNSYVHYFLSNVDGLITISFDSQTQIVATTDTIKVYYKILSLKEE